MSSTAATPALLGASAARAPGVSGESPLKSLERDLSNDIGSIIFDPAVAELFNKQVHTKPFGRVFRVL
jgi:hypothetical protein